MRPAPSQREIMIGLVCMIVLGGVILALGKEIKDSYARPNP